MSFSVGVRGHDELKQRFFEMKSNLITSQLLSDMAEEARSAILKRTARGIDYKGASFKPYSRRWKAERKRQGRQASHVDLNFTGRMLSEVQTTVDPVTGRATVLISGSGTGGRLARYHHSSGAGSSKITREFFGLNESDKEKLKKMLEEHIDEVIKG